jgi:hypothetical protein
MGWYLRKSVKMGPLRLNFSKRGVGFSTGVKGFRIGTGPRGPYVAGGRGGVYFRQSLRARAQRAVRTPTTRTVSMMVQSQPQQAPQIAATQQSSLPQPQPQQNPAQPYAPAAPGPMYSPPARTYHPYRLATLIAVSVAQALAWIFAISDPGTTASDGSSTFGALGTLGMLLWFGSMIAVAVIDWHGFISLRGRIAWWRLSGTTKFWLVCGYIFGFEILLLIYLVIAWIDFRQARIAARQQRPFHIAQMEAELGITPPTEGTCANCGKPLQAGAQFCSYCRAPVTPRPKVCPACATVAQPDAQWCPKCGAALSAQA